MTTFRALCMKLLQDDVGLHAVVNRHVRQDDDDSDDDDDDDDDDFDTSEGKMKLHFLLLPDKTTGLSELCMYQLATSEMLICLTSSCTTFDPNTLTQEDKDSRLRLDESMKSLSKVCYNPIEYRTHFTNNQVWRKMYQSRRQTSSSSHQSKKKQNGHGGARESVVKKKSKTTLCYENDSVKNMSVAKLQNMTCSDLRELARRNGLKRSGRKAELICRLSDHFCRMKRTFSTTKKDAEDEDEIESFL